MAGLSLDAFMALVPVQAVACERLEDGRAVLLRPKFTSPRLAWLQKRLPKPHFRVRLDARGSFIWDAIDGRRTVREVVEAVRAGLGPEAEPVEERAVAFLHHLVSGRFARLETPTIPAATRILES